MRGGRDSGRIHLASLSLTRVVRAGGAEAEDLLLGSSSRWLLEHPRCGWAPSRASPLAMGFLQPLGGGGAAQGSPATRLTCVWLLLEPVFLVTQVAVARTIPSALGSVTTALPLHAVSQEASRPVQVQGE